MNEAAKEYYDAIQRQEKAYWEEFLTDDANIWQVVKYLDPHGSSAFDKVLLLMK